MTQAVLYQHDAAALMLVARRLIGQTFDGEWELADHVSTVNGRRPYLDLSTVNTLEQLAAEGYIVARIAQGRRLAVLTEIGRAWLTQLFPACQLCGIGRILYVKEAAGT